MPDTPDPSDLKLLGLRPGATRGDLRRAYQRARSTWAAGSLATYGLVEDWEREEILARLTAAYERLTRSLEAGPAPGAPHSQEAPPDARQPRGNQVSEAESSPSPPAVDRLPANPAAALRRQRLSKGIAMELLARETRIRPAILEALEEGDTARLPAPVYIRGFIIAYAQAIGLDESEALARRYLEWLKTRGA